MSAMPKKVSKSGIENRIVAVGDIPNYTAMLIYGESGTGKTAFASSFPKPILLLDLREKGTETIAQVEDAFVLPIETWDDFEEAYWFVERDKKYASIILDQITSLQSIAMDKIRSDGDMDPSDTFSKRDWGQMSGLMQTWLLNYRNLWSKEKHLCFCAHQRTFGAEDEAGDNQIEPSVGARLSPSVSSFMNGAVSTIGNTFIQETFTGTGSDKERHVKYCMRVGPHAYFRTKIRKPPSGDPLPDVIVNPTFDKVMRLSRGESLTKSVKKVKR